MKSDSHSHDVISLTFSRWQIGLQTPNKLDARESSGVSPNSNDEKTIVSCKVGTMRNGESFLMSDIVVGFHLKTCVVSSKITEDSEIEKKNTFQTKLFLKSKSE